jgi:hypothetical protein
MLTLPEQATACQKRTSPTASRAPLGDEPSSATVRYRVAVPRIRLTSTPRHDGETIHVPVIPGEGTYTCDGPPNRFIDLILGKSDRNDSPGEAAARSVELLDAAYRSSRSHRPERA